LTTALTASGSFGTGQSITGTYSAAAPGDTIQVRFMTQSGDGILNCSGLPNGSGANTIYVNTFKVQGGQLVCNMNGTDYVLVGGIPGSGLDITKMTIVYGVEANAATTGNNVDTYMTAADVTALGLWNSVISVLVKLTFTNPLSANAGQPATFDIQRVIGVMSQTGPAQ
jgi:type IV pilus assembly protein PilW